MDTLYYNVVIHCITVVWDALYYCSLGCIVLQCVRLVTLYNVKHNLIVLHCKALWPRCGMYNYSMCNFHIQALTLVTDFSTWYNLATSHMVNSWLVTLLLYSILLQILPYNIISCHCSLYFSSISFICQSCGERSFLLKKILVNIFSIFTPNKSPVKVVSYFGNDSERNL